MKDSIATAPRNLFQIKRRQAADLGFRAIRKIGKEMIGRPDSFSDILIYPAISSKTELRDIINRIAWYLPSEIVTSHTIYVPLRQGLPSNVPTSSPDSHPTYDRDHLNIVFIPPEQSSNTAIHIDLILCHSFYDSLDQTLLTNVERVEIIDKEFYSTASCSGWITGTADLRKSPPGISRENFRRLEEKVSNYNNSFVFATGPSLEEAYSFDFPDNSLKVICNSIVRNEELLDHIDPDVLVFADPVFHFGPSRYAHKFRQDAAEVLRHYDCVSAVTAPKRGLLAGHYPDIAEQVIELESVRNDLPRFPTHRSLDVMGTANIMTLLMLPIASSLTDRIQIIGADGREEDESYFWEHSDIAQYDDDMMKTAIDSHPSFFRDRIYTDYYDQHIQTLEKMIAYGERQGLEYISLTESYIECLQNRYNPRRV